MATRSKIRRRTGGVYIAVLGSAMLIALMGMCALIGQRIENRLVVASTDIRQAQLNANAAVELAMLAIKQDSNWRTTYVNGICFTGRSISSGTGTSTCTAKLANAYPLDANGNPIVGSLSNNPDDPVIIIGIGYRGQAEQRLNVTVDPKKIPLTCLRSAIATGNDITLSGDILRTNGLTTANQVSASSSLVSGKVEATSVSGSTYSGTTAQVTSDKRPTMPTWTSVFSYYRTNGTEINIASLPTSLPNLAHNESVTTNDDYWHGNPPAEFGLPSADQADRQTGIGGHAACFRVQRSSRRAGAFQYLDSILNSNTEYRDSILKPNTDYRVDAEVYFAGGLLGASNWFVINLYIQLQDGTVLPAVKGNPEYESHGLTGAWHDISATIRSPNWSGNIKKAFIIVNSEYSSGDSGDFYIDNLSIVEQSTGRFLYQRVISPNVNPFGSTNSQGIYWINCAGNKLVIERSRILGTLLVVNPGANSCINNGPINWSPAVAGYPALLVDSDNGTSADFAICATNRALSEKENGVDFNLDGTTGNYIYPSEIRGLVAIRHDLTYQNRGLVRGQIIVGNNIANASGELEVDYLPDSLLNPPSGFWSYTYSRRTNSTQKAVLP